MKQISLFKRLGIRLFLAMEIPAATISRFYNVHKATIYRVKNRRR